MNKQKLKDTVRLVLKQVSAASALITVVFAVILAFIYLSGDSGNIKDSAALGSLKQKIEEYPSNKELVERFRDVDLQERARYFGKTELLETGKKVFLGFLILSLICFRIYSLLTSRIPDVKKGSEIGFSMLRSAGREITLFSSIITAFIVLVFFVLFSFWGQGELPWQIKEAVKAKTENKLERFNKSAWAGFRGPNGQGVSSFGEYPEVWDAKSPDIIWKNDLAVKAYSSPIVFKDNLFITGSEEKKLKVLSFSAYSGSLNWASTVLVKKTVDDIEVMSEEAGGAGYASPTPATDGEYVYAYFATNHLVCFDYEGKQKWVKFFGKPENMYGLSSSPVLFEDKIILQVDQSGEGLSKIYALNKKTGEIIWETKRPDGASWGTPIVIDYKGKKEVVTTGAAWVIAYEPETGKELWRIDCLSGDVSTSPVYADEKVFVMSVGSQTTVFALSPGGAGDVTKTNIVWKHEEESQAINAPLVLGSKLIVALNGLIVCRDTASGKILWQYKPEDDFWASPAAALNEKIYIPSLKGKVYVFDLAGKLINTADMGGKICASIAFSNSRMYIRTDKSLYCVSGEHK